MRANKFYLKPSCLFFLFDPRTTTLTQKLLNLNNKLATLQGRCSQEISSKLQGLYQIIQNLYWTIFGIKERHLSKISLKIKADSTKIRLISDFAQRFLGVWKDMLISSTPGTTYNFVDLRIYQIK